MPFYEEEPTPVRVRNCSFADLSHSRAMRPTTASLSQQSLTEHQASQMKWSVQLVGAIHVPRSGTNVSQLVLDGQFLYLAYNDYGLELATLTSIPSSSLFSMSSSGQKSFKSGSEVTRSDILTFKTVVRGKESIRGDASK